MERKRKKRHPITIAVIQSLKLMVEKNVPSKIISALLDISISTVNRMKVRLHQCMTDGIEIEETIHKCGRKPAQKASILHNRIVEIIQDNSTLTQNGIIKKLKEENLCCSQATISNVLKKYNIARKRLEGLIQPVMSEEELEERRSYAQEMITLDDSQMIFLDKTGFNLYSSNSYEYSLQTFDVVVNTSVTHNVDVSLIVLLSCNGIAAYKLFDGACPPDSTSLFLNEAWGAGVFKDSRDNTNKILIMDISMFQHPQEIIDWALSKSITIKYLPPSCPLLNPVKDVFAHIKSKYHAIRPPASTISMIKDYATSVISKMIEDKDKRLNGQEYFENMQKYLNLAL